jgi:predicted PurR-regulated permease PerM
MDWHAFSARLLRLVTYLVTAAIVYVVWHRSGLHEISAGEAEGINTLILLIGSIYAVVFAFVIYVIWGQFTDVENFMMRECKSLNELLRFSDFLDPEGSRSIQRAVDDYVQRVVKSEWAALGDRRRDKSSEQAFSELLDAVLHVARTSPQQDAVSQRLIDIVREAGEHRDERLTKSLTQIPATLIHLVHTMAIALLLLVFCYPFHHWAVGVCCFLLLATVLFLANLVMTDTDNPFKGIYNVSPKPFSDLAAAR